MARFTLTLLNLNVNMASICGIVLLTLFTSCYSNKFPENYIETKCRFLKGNVNQLYEKAVQKDESFMYIFEIDRRHFQDVANTHLRVEFEVARGTSLQDPILFSVGQRKYINTFELPVLSTSGTEMEQTFYSAGRTLCLQKRNEGQNITIRVSTTSLRPVNYRLKLILTKDFQIPLGKEVNLEVSPTSPRYLGFQTNRPDISLVKIRASSNSTTCLTMSVQTIRCPIYDKEVNVKYQGLWQTMTTQTAMTLELKHRFEQGFILVLVVHSTDEKCSNSPSYVNPYEPPPRFNDSFVSGIPDAGFGSGQFAVKSPRSKMVKITISSESKESGWIIFLVLTIPIFGTFLLLIIVTVLFRNRHQWMRIEAEQKLTAVNCGLITSLKQDPRANQRLLDQPTAEDYVLHDLGATSTHLQDDDNDDARNNGTGHQSQSNSTRSPIEQFYLNQQGITAGQKLRWKANLYISDFSQKDPIMAQKAGRRFYWTIVIVAIFYCIPVYQLILHYLRVLYRTGEYDICYYNYLCAHRLGVLVDFNHFWSNISYIIFGFAFIFFVSRRAENMREVGGGMESNRQRHASATESDNYAVREGFLKRHFGYSRIPVRSDYGIPLNWGIFYALGIALAMEGVLSAAYHLCPNQSSFQFDTCFMYVISVLILLKIYQFRHSVHFGANHTFALLAAFVLISVIGLMFEFQGSKAKIIYRWMFICVQFLSMTLLVIYGYSLGYVRKNESQQRILTDWKIFCYLNQLTCRQIHCDRLIHPFIMFSLGIAVLIYSEITHLDFATYLLYLLVANVIGSSLYYVGIMKPLHGEFKNRTWVQPVVYFVGAGVLGGFAMRYFVRSPAEWSLSAAASRAGNEECMNSWFPFQPYYDSHDVWHFLSAAALFLSFMALLIVDDDLLTTPQNEIPVF